MRIGTIGTGFIVETFIDAVKENEHCSVIACYSRTQVTANAFATKNNIKKMYTSFDLMLQDEDIDTIYVASPNSLHAAQTKEALLAGKNVICEKPFSSNSKELEEIVALAKEKRLFLFEAITTIHLPNYKWIKENLHLLGDLKMVMANFSQYSRKYDEFKSGGTPNVFTTTFSGGALMDLNIYNLHFVMGLFSEPKEVHYFANKTKGIDTSGALLLDYDDFKCSLVACKDSRSLNSLQIQGEKGYFRVINEPSKCGEVEYVTNEGIQTISLHKKENRMYYEVLEFLRIVDNKDYQKCYDLLDYSLTVMRVLDKARKSAQIEFKADCSINLKEA